jgi:hypothetical protein
LSEQPEKPKKKPGRPAGKKNFVGRPPKTGMQEAQPITKEEAIVAKYEGIKLPYADRYTKRPHHIGFCWLTIYPNGGIQVADSQERTVNNMWVPVEGGDDIKFRIQVGRRVCVPKEVAIILEAANSVKHPVYDEDLAMRQLKDNGFGTGLRYEPKTRWPFSVERDATPEEFEEFVTGKKVTK